MTTQVLTPSQQRRDRIRRLEELVRTASAQLVDLYRLEGYEPLTRRATTGVRRQVQHNLADDRLALEIPGAVVNAWAIREGRRAPGTRGAATHADRHAFVAAGTPGWPPPPRSNATDAEIRAWCRTHGVPVNDHGGVAQAARLAYDTAHQEQP